MKTAISMSLNDNENKSWIHFLFFSFLEDLFIPERDIRDSEKKQEPREGKCSNWVITIKEGM